MNPCRDCLKVYGEGLCSITGHCAFEGTDEKPEPVVDTALIDNPRIVSPKEADAS